MTRATKLLGAVVRPIDRVMSLAAYAGVMAYKRFVSPYKGYRCSYALAHAGPSCSDVASRAFRTEPIWLAVPTMFAQFNACHESARARRGDAFAAAGQHMTRFTVFGLVGVMGGCCCIPGGDDTPKQPDRPAEPTKHVDPV